MSTVYIWQTIIEVAVGALIIYGIFHEDRFVAFEERIISRFKKRG